LHAVANDCDGFFLQYLAGFRQAEFLAGYDGFLRAAKINYCHGILSLSGYVDPHFCVKAGLLNASVASVNAQT